MQSQASTPTESICPVCGGLSDYGLPFEGACSLDCQLKADQQKRADAKRAEDFKSIMGSPKALAEFKLELYKPREGTQDAIEAAKYFTPDRDNLYLYGACGTGKTHLAYALARKQHEQGKDVMILKPQELFRRFRKRDAEDEEREIRRFAKFDVLVIDDLGVEKTTEFALSILYEIIDRRVMDYRNGLVITSNLSPKALAEKIGDDRIPSRLGSLCRFIRLGTGSDEDDFRQNKRSGADRRDYA